MRIFITDVNDNAPAFSQPVYEISVEEDKEVGYVVITVTANDEDEGKNIDCCYKNSTRIITVSKDFILVIYSNTDAMHLPALPTNSILFTDTVTCLT